MTAPSHTPGPWEVQGSKIVAVEVRPDWATDEDDADERVSVVDLYGAMGGNDTRADARLIAAAPALLEALHGLLAEVECTSAYEDAMSGRDAPLLAAVAKAINAIALATGSN